MDYLQNINGVKITKNKLSNRIININFEDELVDKLIFPFNKFDITALEYKPFTRFTIAKSLDDLTQNKLSHFIKQILNDRTTGCIIFHTNNKNKNVNEVHNKIMKLNSEKR